MMLRREGWQVNHKRIYRLYCEEGLAVRTKKRRRRPSHLGLILPPAEGPNERWSMDFVVVENGYIESFNGRLRDECLNANLLFSIEDGRRKLEAWRADYNTERPHSSLGDRSPRELLEAHHQEVSEASILNL